MTKGGKWLLEEKNQRKPNNDSFYSKLRWQVFFDLHQKTIYPKESLERWELGR